MTRLPPTMHHLIYRGTLVPFLGPIVSRKTTNLARAAAPVAKFKLWCSKRRAGQSLKEAGFGSRHVQSLDVHIKSTCRVNSAKM